MRCGAKCFQVVLEIDNKRINREVNARTPANARKIIKQQYGEAAKIHSAIAKTNFRK